MSRIKVSKNINVLLYIFLLIMLLPYITTGYMGDDILNSLIEGDSINNSRNIIMTIIFYLSDSIKKGRINFVFLIYNYIVFYFVPNKLCYKVWIIFLTVISVYAAERFVINFFDNVKLGRLFCSICIVLFPFYMSGSNSVVMYVGYMQIEVILLFEMLSALIQYCNKGEKRYLIYSYILYAISMFIYEISYIFIILILIVLWSNTKIDNLDKKKIAKKYIYILGISCLIVLAVKGIGKVGYPDLNYDGISVNFDIQKILETFFTQFIGAIPLLNLWKEKTFVNKISPRTIILLVFLSALFFIAIKKDYIKKEEVSNDSLKKCMFMLEAGFLTLWLGCSGLISITLKYQTEINVTGVPHIPVYIEYFCFSMVMFCLMLQIREQKYIREIALCVMFLGALANCLFGEVLIQNYIKNTSVLYNKMPQLYNVALNNGLCESITDEDVILIDNSYSPTIYPNLFAQCLKRKIRSERLDMFLKRINSTGDMDGMTYFPEENLYITKSFVGDSQGIVYCDKIEAIIYDESGGVDSILINEINAYYESSVPFEGLPIVQNGKVTVEEISGFEVRKLEDDKYLINSIGGSYDYYSYTYWQ